MSLDDINDDIDINVTAIKTAVTNPISDIKTSLISNTDENLTEDETPNHKSGLFPGDLGELSLDTRRVLVQLLSGPYLDAKRHSKLWSVLLRDESVIRKYLCELFLELDIDYDFQVAFTRQINTDDLEVPRLLRRAQLTFLDSVLLLYLRQQLSQAQTHNERAVVSKDEIVDQLKLYNKAGNTDEAGFVKKIYASIEKMKKHNILRKIKAAEDRFEVSPTLKLLFSPEDIQALTKLYRGMKAGDDIKEESTDYTD